MTPAPASILILFYFALHVEPFPYFHIENTSSVSAPMDIFVLTFIRQVGPPTTGKGSSTASDRSSRSGSPSSVADDRDLVIGDFGGGDFYDASKHPDPLRQMTVTYRPPEYDTKLKPVSRSWDVWGLGCTYLEFVTWFLLGRAGLKEFAKRRTTRTAAGKLSDEYFDTFVDPSQTGGIGAILKGSVLAWINDLSRHRNASPFIRDFLNFITHRMFIIEDAIVNRASGDEVAEHMNSLNEKCRQDDSYCAPSAPAFSPWDVESTDSSITTLSSTTPDDFTLDFTTTEDVSGGSNVAWNLSMDLNPLQWNTAPVLPANGLATYSSLNCADVLGTWNYTAPVMWNNEITGQASASVENKRKRKVNEDVEGFERRVSPKTSISPQESGSSTAEESPAAISAKVGEKRFACPYCRSSRDSGGCFTRADLRQNRQKQPGQIPTKENMLRPRLAHSTPSERASLSVPHHRQTYV